MAIESRKGKNGVSYQVKLRGTDGRWITETFLSEKEAKIFESRTKLALLTGASISQTNRQMTVDEFWQRWIEDGKGEVTEGWRMNQKQIYRDYIAPMIGGHRMNAVTVVHVKRLLQAVNSKGRSPQTCRHVFAVIHKMFGDAVEDYDLITSNPVKRKLKPELPETERPHLSVEEIKTLLHWVRGKPFEMAIWFGIYVGLRVGEIQGLLWNCVDFERGVVHVRATFARKEKIMRSYPKGRKWHSPTLPDELLAMLRKAKETSLCEFVCSSPDQPMLSYNGYYKALKRYCREAGIQEVATHGLRHSTAEIYMANGATKDDLRELFAHSSSRVTDKYIHGKSERLAGVAKIIQLRPTAAGES